MINDKFCNFNILVFLVSFENKKTFKTANLLLQQILLLRNGNNEKNLRNNLIVCNVSPKMNKIQRYEMK